MGQSMTTATSQTAFPALLKAFRQANGISQVKLAERLEIAKNTLKAWERGDPRRQPHVLTREGVVFRLRALEQELHGDPVANSPDQS
jgi:transcriptional regulator with XRE-family HTH domain